MIQLRNMLLIQTFFFQATFGIMATNVLGVLLGWLYNSLALGVIHCGFSLAAFIFLPATPYELVRSGRSERLIPLLQKLRGDQVGSIDQEATFIIRSLKGITPHLIITR